MAEMLFSTCRTIAMPGERYGTEPSNWHVYRVDSFKRLVAQAFEMDYCIEYRNYNSGTGSHLHLFLYLAHGAVGL